MESKRKEKLTNCKWAKTAKALNRYKETNTAQLKAIAELSNQNTQLQLRIVELEKNEAILIQMFTNLNELFKLTRSLL